MRTLRGTISNENGDISDSKNQAKSKTKNEDDDVGASGDETTDDEGGVDTPPPTCEEDEDSKDDEKDEIDESTKKEMLGEIKELKSDEKNNIEKKNGVAKNTKKKSEKQKNIKKNKEKRNNETEKEEEYEVEQIVDMETSQRWKCPVKFRVRWVGYTEKEDSWLSASELSCDELIKDFLEISGRKSEYERAYEAKKKSTEWINDNYRQSARKTSRVTYSELDEDEEEILPSGTKSRKVKTKAEKKQMPVLPVKRKARKAPVISSKKSKSRKEEIHEVETISGMREVKGNVEYKVRWKNWNSQHDSWLREEELNCPELLKHFKESQNKLEKEEDWQVEKILDERERKGKKEFLVHWKGFESKHDTWEPEENLCGCPEILNSFKLKKEKSKPKLLNEKRKKREEKPQTERFAKNNSEGPRSHSKLRKRNAATSYSEFYEQ